MEATDVVKEMSLSSTEFSRQLERMCEGFEVTGSDDRYRIHVPDSGKVEIRLTVLPPRRIAAISLPVMKVEINFGDMAEERAKLFLARFNLYFRKGGG